MAVSVNEFINYIAASPDDEKPLRIYLDAAVSKARSAGIPNYEDNAQYDMFIYSLAAMYYDNRGLTFGGAHQQAVEENARRMINSFVLELRYAGEDVQEGADG